MSSEILTLVGVILLLILAGNRKQTHRDPQFFW